MLGEGCASLPERLLLHHAEGKVLFLAGAGVSMSKPAGLPSFTDLVLKVYKRLGDPVLPFLEALAGKKVDLPKGLPLTPDQKAETKSFEKQQLDVVLGMLERRIDGQQTEESRMRQAVVDTLQPDPPPEHAGIHRDLMRLSDRGGPTAILTTNFDLLLEAAAKGVKSSVESLALGAIPRPSLRPSFSGVLHLHGALRPERSGIPDLILTNRDFGEFYLRRRIVPDLLYDAARIYHLVLVGYTANDPPVRYLLDAISADDTRFPDLKERFIFVPFKGKEPDETELADWKARGLTPVPYSRADKHQQLAFTLETWANLFEKTPSLGGRHETVTERRIRKTLERITEAPLNEASDEDRGLFDHLIRREVHTRRAELSSQLGKLPADYSWLDRILEVIRGRIEGDGSGAVSHDRPLAELERKAAHCVQNFALERLEEEATITWARRLALADRASRRGLQRLLSRRAIWREPLSEPWATAWQLVQESWRAVPYVDLDEARSGSFEIGKRLERGDRSLALAEKMAEFVTPSLQLNDPWKSLGVDEEGDPPMTWDDLFRAELRSVSMTELRQVDLADVDDLEFLSRLIRALEAVLVRSLDLGRWIVGKDDLSFLGLGPLQRVYFVDAGTENSYEAVARGVAPAAKLLHAAVEQFARVAPPKDAKILRRRFSMGHPVHRRLWAALARDGRLVKVAELKEGLHGLTDNELWLPDHPEFSELLALRFGELDPKDQWELLARLRDGPQSELWPGVDADKAKEWNLRSSLRQMEQIRAEGGVLPVEFEEWLDTSLAERPEFELESDGHDITSGGELASDREEPDLELDKYGGPDLLAELEERLAHRDPVRRGGAGSWLESRMPKVLAAMEEEVGTGLDLPHVWEAIGWRYRPPDDDGQIDSQGDVRAEVRRVLELLRSLTDEALAKVVEYAVRWWSNWGRRIQPDSLAREVWLRLWPHAVNATNARSGGSSLEYDMSNTPAGSLARSVGPLAPEPRGGRLLTQDAEFGAILAAAVGAPGRAGRVAFAWLACNVGWYLRHDQPWADQHLLPILKERSDPSKGHSGSAVALWDAVGRLGLPGAIPSVLAADAMELIERSDDPRLSQWSRQRLLSKFLWDSLRASFNGTEPVVEGHQLRQLLSRLDGEMRSWGAMQLWRCLVNSDDGSLDAEEVFRKAVAPFLKNIWPQELDLVTRGVSHSMARIPAASRGEFIAAVDAVARFLVPGSTGSRHDYGLYGEEDGEERLEIIVDSQAKAEALLRLLDLTVGGGEGVSTPLGLDELLARIRDVAPTLVERPEFVRLTTLAQRSRFK